MTKQTERILTYVDTCLLMAAFRNKSERDRAAAEILEDERRVFITSDALWLELMPKAVYNKCTDEAAFYADFFGRAEQHQSWNLAVLQSTRRLAAAYGLSAMDAIHIAHAIDAGVDEFVSAERLTKPMFRVLELTMRSIALA